MSLDDKMTELADAIRSKTGKTGKLSIHQMVSALTPSGNVYWNGNLLGDLDDANIHLFAKPIPAHTKISDIIITSDKPTDAGAGTIILKFENPDKVNMAYVDYTNGWWFIHVSAPGEYEDVTELPDDLIGISTFATINNLKIVVKGTGISELPTYTNVLQAYTGLANAIKKSTGTSGKLTIEKMINLLGGTTSKDDTPATPSQPVTPSQPATPSKTVTVFENLQISTFGGGSYDFTSPVPLGDTRLEVTLQVVNSGTGSVTISIPGTSISKTIASGGWGYHTLTATLDIPSGMANSIKAINVDVGRRNALKQLTVVAK
ncbi:hypothetical protein [Limosilactobacillus avium]|uniref:hypothetical protein n=1 Tax=Limosilactobacillus avium TaxID=2991831 RepID=UPI0024BA871E|nr:hypothetical protein [Limosilactobacillus avium]